MPVNSPPPLTLTVRIYPPVAWMTTAQSAGIAPSRAGAMSDDAGAAAGIRAAGTGPAPMRRATEPPGLSLTITETVVFPVNSLPAVFFTETSRVVFHRPVPSAASGDGQAPFTSQSESLTLVFGLPKDRPLTFGGSSPGFHAYLFCAGTSLASAFQFSPVPFTPA